MAVLCLWSFVLLCNLHMKSYASSLDWHMKAYWKVSELAAKTKSDK